MKVQRRRYTPDEIARIYIDRADGVSYKQLSKRYDRKVGAIYQVISNVRHAMDGNNSIPDVYKKGAKKVCAFYDFQGDNESMFWSTEDQEIKELPDDPTLKKRTPSFTPPKEIDAKEVTQRATDNLNDFLDVVKKQVTNLATDLATAIVLENMQKTVNALEARDGRIKELEQEIKDLRTIRDTAKRVNIAEVISKRLERFGN